MRKRTLSLLLCAVLSLSLLAGCGAEKNPSADFDSVDEEYLEDAYSEDDTYTEDEEDDDYVDSMYEPTVRMHFLTGPLTLCPLQQLSPVYGHIVPTFVDTVEEAAQALLDGTADAATVPPIAAARLYHETNGAIKVVAVTNLSYTYLLEKGDTVHSIKDLKGKTVYAAGQGAEDEYLLEFLLKSNQMDPADVDVQFMEPEEVMEIMASSDAAICMLPVPYSTELMMQDPEIQVAVSLAEAWQEQMPYPLPYGCIVARTDFIEKDENKTEGFVTAYGAELDSLEGEFSLITLEDYRNDTMELVEKFGFPEDEETVVNIITQSNVHFAEADEMQSMLQDFYDYVLYDYPEVIGGDSPAEDFYYSTIWWRE